MDDSRYAACFKTVALWGKAGSELIHFAAWSCIGHSVARRTEMAVEQRATNSLTITADEIEPIMRRLAGADEGVEE
jgi:hypothetical protein